MEQKKKKIITKNKFLAKESWAIFHCESLLMTIDNRNYQDMQIKKEK